MMFYHTYRQGDQIFIEKNINVTGGKGDFSVVYSIVFMGEIMRRCQLPCIKHDETFGSLFVKDSVAAVPTSDGVSLSDFVFCVALATDVDHGLADGRVWSPAPNGRTRCFVSGLHHVKSSGKLSSI